MKKIGLLFSILFVASQLFSQNVEISGLYGYQFGNKIDYYGGYVKIREGSNYGGSIGYNTGSNVIVQLSYTRNESAVDFRDYILSPNETQILDANMDWFSIGAVRTTGDGPLYGYIGGGLGLLFSTPANQNLDVLDINVSSQTNFFFEVKAGGTAMFNEHIGFRAQALLQCPVDYGGVYFGYGTGGPSTGVSLNSTVVIFSLQGGIVFTIPR